MKGGRAGPKPDKELVRLIRQSRVLDPLLKRQWLRIIEHLTPADRERLREILRSEQPAEPESARPS